MKADRRIDMRKLKFKLGLMALLLMSLAPVAGAQTTYWLGTRDGDALRFETQVPADAAAVIMHKDKAPNGGEDTTPRYRTFTHTIDGKAVRFYANEIGWETPKLNEGSLTWVANAEALKSLATNAGGWSSAKVVIAESTGKAAPSFRVNRNGSIGKPPAATVAEWRLEDMSSKAALPPDELDAVRGYMLDIANGGRANPNYRRQAGCKTALDVPSGLKPLVLSDPLNKAAQIQADYCAKVKEATHDHGEPNLADLGLRLKSVGYDKVGYEAAGSSGSLADYPTEWMKSETHYRPWWNLDGQVVTEVGYGVAKADDGNWYLVAVLG
jgi:uncharacterized protein YkwD